MTRCLRVRVGRVAYLVPAESVGAIAPYRNDNATPVHHRVIDARRMATGGAISPAPLKQPVAVEWRGPQGCSNGLVLVDDVEGLIEIDATTIAALPVPARGLGIVFDGFWYDSARAAFLLHLRTGRLATFTELRQLARLLAPLSAVRRPDHVDG